jgi:tRNA dimethylallyltransferase
MGPTAVGKTDLAVALAMQLPVDVISVDSAMVYRDMDIGTGKPDREVLRKVPHRLVDICSPDEVYSAARFVRDARRHIAAIEAAGRYALLVGGTGLYFRALLQGLSSLPSASTSVRARLAQELQSSGANAMHQRLRSVDPDAAGRIHPNDPQRITRALEVWEMTGEPISRLQGRRQSEPIDAHRMVLLPESRQWLHERIETRFRGMLDAGLVDEVRALRDSYDLDDSLPSMRSVGYRQVWEYLEGGLDADQMTERAIVATRQLARRQLTWLRREPDLEPLTCGVFTPDAVVRRVRESVERASR